MQSTPKTVGRRGWCWEKKEPEDGILEDIMFT